jgi:3-methyladenine DNA glycosylase/8-oxoguanine DNA glycosylase
MELRLAARPPFSLSSVVLSHGWIRLAPFVEDQASGGLRYVLRLRSGRAVDLSISETDGGVLVTTGAALGPDEIDEAGEAVTWMLGLDQDFSAFYERCRHEPKLAHAQRSARGRLLRSATLFEDVVKTLLTTNTAWSGTVRMNAALVELYGEPATTDGARRAFPTPAALARTSVEELRAGPKLGYRAPYVLELARAVDSGELDLEALKRAELPTPELRKRLLSLKGVGGYAASNLLNLLGRYDFLPVDSWALKMVSQEWHGGQAVTPADVEAAFAAWGEWKGLAYWFWNWNSAS